VPVYYPLDKTIIQGTTYQTPRDIGYLVLKIGTDGSTDTKLVVDGKPTGAITSDFAPMIKSSSNLLGPLPLGELYYVVPPDTKFWVDGPSGAKMRLVGKIVKLVTGESFPGDLMARFDKQFDEYITYISDSYSLGTDVDWTDGTEYDILVHTPKTIEKIVLDSVVMAKIENFATDPGYGAVGIRFKLDGDPLDILTDEPGMRGVDYKYMPYPPTPTAGEIPFTLAPYPITVEGDHTLTITAINDSGSSLSPSSGASITVTVLAVIKYFRKR